MSGTPPPVYRIEISVKTLLFGLLLLLGLGALYMVRELVVLLLLSCVLAASLYPPVAWLKKRHFSRRISILLFYLLFLLIAVGFGFGLSTLLISQGKQFFAHLPLYLDSAGRFLRQIPFISTDEELLALLSRNLETLASHLAKFVFSSLDYLLVVFNGVLGLMTVLVFTYFLLSDTEYFEGVVLKLVPPPSRSRVRELLQAVALKVGFYIRGQLMVMALMGILTSVGLAIIGVPYALVLGSLVFVLDIIPIVGPIAASAFGVLIALGQDPVLAVWAALVYFIAQQTESYVFSPMILGRTLGLHPFWILFSLILGGALLGIPGVFLAVPTAATVRLLVDELYVKGYMAGKYPDPLPDEASGPA